MLLALLRNKFFVYGLILVALISIGYKAYGETPRHRTVVDFDRPLSLVGKWHQTSGMDGITMSAEISDSGIQIWMHAGNSVGIFWQGTFDPNVVSRSSTITSVGDQDAMALDIFASSETTKKFNYKDGDLSFEFSVMKVESTVHLSRGAK